MTPDKTEECKFCGYVLSHHGGILLPKSLWSDSEVITCPGGASRQWKEWTEAHALSNEQGAP